MSQNTNNIIYMKEYKVSLELQVNAENPLDAAKTIQSWMDEMKEKWQFYVQAEDEKQIYSVDLEEEDEYAVCPVDEYEPLINVETFYKKELLSFAFNFYYDLSKEKGVPENLISENFTLVEEYFNKIYK